MRLGIGSYTYAWAVGVPGYPPPRQPLGALDLLAKAAALGVSVVQFADNVPLHRENAAGLDALRTRADELGLELELGTAGTNPEQLRCYLALARRLRARVLRTLLDTATERPTLAEAAARLRAVLPECERSGVTLAIENHDRFRATALRELILGLASPCVGLCLDTANSLGALEGWEEVLDVLGPHVASLHLKDVRAARLPHHQGFVIEGTPAGQGQIDFVDLLARVRAAGADPNAILELWPPPADDVEAAIAQEESWARASIAYLRKLIPH